MRDQALSYLIDAKQLLTDAQKRTGWDLFISAYNDSERVKTVFSDISAGNKCWWLLPEYGYSQAEHPNGGSVIDLSDSNEADLVITGLQQSKFSPSSAGKICIDITGFMRSHILFFLKYLKSVGVHSFEMLYTEPERYSRKAETKFTLDEVAEVRQVAGFEGQHVTDMSNDVLIVGVGYDHGLMSRVVLEKESSRLMQLHCFPSLSADMYHESILRLDRVASAQDGRSGVFFSSANDPYVTASALSDARAALSDVRPITNLYLSPLATKPHTLGFGLFYLRELEGEAASIVFPFSTKYSRETSKGVGRSWVYPIIF